MKSILHPCTGLIIAVQCVSLLSSCGNQDPAQTSGAVETATRSYFAAGNPIQTQVRPRTSNPPETAAPASKPSTDSQLHDHDLKLGETIFTNHCLKCHAKGVYDAPKFGNASDWKKRVKQDQGTLIQHAIKGHGRMPPKGGFFRLSDEEVAAAVAYVVDKSKEIIASLKKKQAASECHPVKNPDRCRDANINDVMTLHLLWMLGTQERK